MTAKQLEKLSKKAEKDEAKAKDQVKRAIQQGNRDGARIYAENAIRKKNEALNFLRMSSRVDAVTSRIQTALSMKQVTKEMGGVVHGLDQAMASMNLEEITKIMDKFEKQFETLDTQAGVLEGAIAGVTSTSMPEDQVDLLMQQVADENGLEIQQQLDSTTVTDKLHAPATAVGALTHKEDDDLTKRLAALRQ